MEGSNIRIVLIGVLTAVMLLFGCPAFLHHDDACISLVHHFFHANLFHLAVNCYSIWNLFRRGVRYSAFPLVLAFVFGTLSWFCTSADAVGFSNIIFALVGLRTPSISSGWWKGRGVITFLSVNVFMLLLPQVSAITHVVSFALGCIAAGMIRSYNRISRDYHRASYC